MSFVRRHPFDVQVLDHHRLVLAAEPSRELMHEIRSDGRDARGQPCKGYSCLHPLPTSKTIPRSPVQWSNVTPRCGSRGLVKRTASHSAFSRPLDKVKVFYRVHQRSCMDRCESSIIAL